MLYLCLQWISERVTLLKHKVLPGLEISGFTLLKWCLWLRYLNDSVNGLNGQWEILFLLSGGSGDCMDIEQGPDKLTSGKKVSTFNSSRCETVKCVFGVPVRSEPNNFWVGLSFSYFSLLHTGFRTKSTKNSSQCPHYPKAHTSYRYITYK